MKLWRRRATQDQTLRSVSAYSSENSYTEEPYMNPDSQSAVYAELAHGLNTYSEIPDPGRPLPDRLILSDYGYGNSAYAISEPNSEPADSSSTPSSAYYSDVSNDARVNKKKRKKKRGNGRDPNEVTVVSTLNPNNIVVPPISLSRSINRTESNSECFPVAIQALPHNFSLERHVPNYPCMSCAPCNPRTTLPFVRPQCNLTPVVLNACTNAFTIHHPIYHTEVHPPRPSLAAVTSLLGRKNSQAVTSTTGVHQAPADHNILPGHPANAIPSHNVHLNPHLGAHASQYHNPRLHPNAITNHHNPVTLPPNVAIRQISAEQHDPNNTNKHPLVSVQGLAYRNDIPISSSVSHVDHKLPTTSAREYTNIPLRPSDLDVNHLTTNNITTDDDLRYSSSEYV